MSFADAAIAVLSDRGAALTTKEVTEEALRRGLIPATGKTPVASMSAALYREVLQQRARIKRIAIEGPVRARRGSVKWKLTSR